MCHSLYKEVRAALWSQFSLSTFMWVLGFKLRSLRLGGNRLLTVDRILFSTSFSV